MISTQLCFIEKLRDNFMTHKLFIDSILAIDSVFQSTGFEDDFIQNMPYKYFMDKFVMDYNCEYKQFNDRFIASLQESLKQVKSDKVQMFSTNVLLKFSLDFNFYLGEYSFK